MMKLKNMKKLLVTFALALILAPVVASAAPQTITIEYNSDLSDFFVVSSDPPITSLGGSPVALCTGSYGCTTALSKKVRDVLNTLGTPVPPAGKQYSCKGTAFFMNYGLTGPVVGISKLSLGSCIALN
jgi:hypothetical protein